MNSSDCMSKDPRDQTGFTLIELVVALVIISMAATTIVGMMSAVATRSSATMQQIQAGNIADAYLREILSRPFADPNVDGEIARAAFDDVNDYHNLNDAGASDRFGNAIAGLNDYQIRVLAAPTALNVNPAGQSLPAAQALLVTVTVTSPSGFVTTLSGYKTQHP